MSSPPVAALEFARLCELGVGIRPGSRHSHHAGAGVGVPIHLQAVKMPLKCRQMPFNATIRVRVWG
jgi:hypothetical protein